jgi:peptidoglycan/LPS O-acetylase OafA/YrhL
MMGVACAHWWTPYLLGFPVGSGVQLFFVISGFLITGILIDCWTPGERNRERMLAMRNFYLRRFLRIFPLYYVMLVGAFLLNIEPVRQTILWHLTYATNFYLFVHQDWHGRISHLWSLAVEEQFYLLWPAVVLFVPRRLLWKTILGMVIFAPLFRLGFTQYAPQEKMVSVLTPSCFDALGIGALLACTLREERGSLKAIQLSRLLLIVGLPLFVLTFALYDHSICSHLTGSFYPTFLVMFYGWLVFSAVQGFQGMGQLLSWRPMVYLGQISYGLYIFHYFAPWFAWWVLAHLRVSEAQAILIFENPWKNILLLSTLTTTGAMLSWHFLEQPINRLKAYFPYRKTV